MLKTHQNGPERDNLLSYAATDPLMKRMLADQPDDNDADNQAQLARQRLMSSPEFKELKRKMRVRHADGTTGPVSDNYVLDQLMRRRAARSKQTSQEEQ